jgi:hypothetical protein
MTKDDDERRLGGRPPRHEGERLNKNRTFRIRDELDRKLQEAAAQSKRSVSEEIEYRLERSFMPPFMPPSNGLSAFEQAAQTLAGQAFALAQEALAQERLDEAGLPPVPKDDKP